MSGKRVRAGRGRDLVSDGNQTKYIINFIIKFISGFEKEMCQNAVAENVEREEELRTLIRNIWHSFHYRNPRLSQDPLALPLCFSLLVFLWHFPLILQCIFCCSSDIQSRISVSKLGQGSLTGVWGTWQVLYGRAGGCSV